MEVSILFQIYYLMHSYTFLSFSFSNKSGGEKSGPQNVRTKQLANKSYMYHQPTYQLISKRSQLY